MAGWGIAFNQSWKANDLFASVPYRAQHLWIKIVCKFVADQFDIPKLPCSTLDDASSPLCKHDAAMIVCWLIVMVVMNSAFWFAAEAFFKLPLKSLLICGSSRNRLQICSTCQCTRALGKVALIIANSGPW